jgi:hypothetical protein
VIKQKTVSYSIDLFYALGVDVQKADAIRWQYQDFGWSVWFKVEEQVMQVAPKGWIGLQLRYETR